MDQDQLEWHWDGVNDFQTKFNDLRTRASRNFRLPALTFDEARFVKEKLTGGRAEPNTKPRKFKGVPATTCWGIEN
jgi:hypothetical protein